MASDLEKQNIPLVGTSSTEPQESEADSVNKCILQDDADGIGQLFQKYKPENVWCPQLSTTQATRSTSSLHKAVNRGAINCLQALLKASPPSGILNKPDYTGKTPMMVAAVEAHPRAVEMLIKAGSFVNTRTDKGQSSLHLIVYEIERGALPQETLQEVADILLSHPEIDLEAHNDSDLTPLAAAAVALSEGRKSQHEREIILLCQKLVKAGASLEARAGQETVKNILKSKGINPSEWAETRAQISPIRPSASVFLDMIIQDRDVNEVKDFLKDMPQERAETLANLCLGSHTLLFRAVDKGNEPFVELLLSAGANTWTLEITNELPVHRAVSSGNFKILDHIITHMKSDKKEVDLRIYTFDLVQKLVEGNKNPVNVSLKIDHSKCLKILMKPDVLLDCNQENVDGNSNTTPLHVAATFNEQVILQELLCHGAYLGERRMESGKDCGNVLDILLPSTLEDALDSCISHHPTEKEEDEAENFLSNDYTLNLDYRFLLPLPQSSSIEDVPHFNELETLNEIRKSKVHQEAIKHPLIRSLLYAKWYKTFPLYIFNLLTCFIFVSILTSFVYNLRDLRVLEDRIHYMRNRTNTTVSPDDIRSQHITVYVLMALLIPAVIFMIVKEAFQVVFSKVYFTKIENYRHWCLIVLILILIIAPLEAEGTCHLAAWAMILAWYEFVLILGRAPSLSIYITMLYHVSWSFMKLIFIYGALIYAITVSFNIILWSTSTEEEIDEGDYWMSLIKTIIMAAGEFDLSDLKERFSRKLLFLASTVLFLLLLVFLIFLVLMNLMVGLAVVNTQKVFEDTDLYTLTSRLDLLHLIETTMLRNPLLRRYVNRIQLLSGPHNTPILRARINKEAKRRLAYGSNYDDYCKLDDGTARIIRSHRLRHSHEKRRQ